MPILHEVTLPSGRTCSVRPFTTREQKDQFRLLHDRKRQAEAVTGFMVLCVEVLDGEPVAKATPAEAKALQQQLLAMLSEDRKAVLLAIRRATLGDEFAFAYTCPACRRQTEDMSVTLGDVEVRPYPHGDERDVEVEVDSGLTADSLMPGAPPRRRRFLVHLLDGAAEARATKIPQGEVDNLTALALRTPREQGKDPADPEKWCPVVLDADLSPWEVTLLAKAVREAEGLVDMVLVVTCPHCQRDGRTNLVGELAFFWPGMRL